MDEGRNKIRSFRDLVAWQKSMDLAKAVYGWSARFPPEERFGMTSQIRRAAASIPANIAEGWGRGPGADFQRFLRVGRGSVNEVETFALLAVTLGFEQEVPAEIAALLSESSRLLNGLIANCERRKKK